MTIVKACRYHSHLQMICNSDSRLYFILHEYVNELYINEVCTYIINHFMLIALQMNRQRTITAYMIVKQHSLCGRCIFHISQCLIIGSI